MRKLTFLLFLVLPACGSPEQMAARHAAIVQANANAMSRIDGHCTSTGLTPGTEAYVDCLKVTASENGYALVALADEKQLSVVPANKGIPGYTVPPSPHTPASWQ